MSIFRTLRLKIYEPSLEFYRSNIDIFEVNILDKCSGSFQCRYRLPNSLIPRLQSRVLLTTEELVYLTSQYDDGAIISFDEIDDMEIDQGLFRIHTYNRKIEIQITNPMGEEFAELTIEAWREYHGKIGENVSEEAEKMVEEMAKLDQDEHE